MNKMTFILFTFTLLFTERCTIVPPSVNLTGEQTAIERQIIGEYREIEKDAWTVSSVKTPVGRKTSSGRLTGDPELIKAIKVREFHNDKISAYKAEYAVGEKNDGYIAYMEIKKYETSPDDKKILMTVIHEENQARKEIFTSLAKNSDSKEDHNASIESFGRLFAEEQRGLARNDEWIQDNTGRWIRKK